MDRKEELAQRLSVVRERTLSLMEVVPDEFLRTRVHSFYSPIGWHFGHIGRTEEYWVSQATGRSPADERLSFLYADLPDNPKDNRVNIPDRKGTVAYLRETRCVTVDALENADLDSDDPFLRDGYAWEFAIQHECQHQETIAEMLQLIQMHRPQPPVEGIEWRGETTTSFLGVPGGEFIMGHADSHGYDNEKDPHKVQVEPFRVAEFPVTAFEWSAFIEEGGYGNENLWTPQGWAWKNAENANMPDYWFKGADGYGTIGPFGSRPVHPDEPASSIGKHEAEAFAKWSGKRLLTEPEWEYLASSAGKVAAPSRYPWGDETVDETRACHGLRSWKPLPVGSHPKGANPQGVQDLAGNVWEWTSSPFLPYPGFRAFPYAGYSQDHMDGQHFVCRGGSWATSPQILRCSFRNWYVPTYRQGFLGVRLAE